jgi:hypothetical protein
MLDRQIGQSATFPLHTVEQIENRRPRMVRLVKRNKREYSAPLCYLCEAVVVVCVGVWVGVGVRYTHCTQSVEVETSRHVARCPVQETDNLEEQRTNAAAKVTTRSEHDATIVVYTNNTKAFRILLGLTRCHFLHHSLERVLQLAGQRLQLSDIRDSLW